LFITALLQAAAVFPEEKRVLDSNICGSLKTVEDWAEESKKLKAKDSCRAFSHMRMVGKAPNEIELSRTALQTIGNIEADL
jgi:hypothetical protein